MTRDQFIEVGTPCIVLMPFQPKLGQRLPVDLPVVVNAYRYYPDNTHDGLLRWMHMFISLSRAPHRGGPKGRNFIAWQDGSVDEIDLDACPTYVNS